MKPNLKSLFQRLSRPIVRVMEWVVTPAAALPDGERRVASLLMTLQILIVFLGLIFEGIYLYIFPKMGSELAIISTLVALIGAYGLCKIGKAKLSASITVGIATLGVFGAMLNQPDRAENIDFLMLLSLTLLIGNLFFNNRTIAAIASLQIFAILCLPLFYPDLNVWELISNPVSFLVTSAVLLVLSNRYRLQVEKSRQAELIASEERFRQIAETIQDVFWTYDRETGRIIYVSPAFEKIFGESPERFYEDPDYILTAVEPADRDLVTRMFRQIEQGERVSFECRLRKPNGSLHWAWVRGFPVYDTGGQLTRTAGLITDITNSKQAGQALAESEARYRQAITAADAIPYNLDYIQNEYLFIGAEIEKLTGYTSAEITPQLLDELILESVMQGNFEGVPIKQAIALVRSGEHGLLWKCDHRMRTRSGEERWVTDASIQVLDESGQPVGSIGIFQDITERKQTEQALRQSEEKYRLLATELEERIKERTAELQDLYDNAPCGYHSLDRNGVFVMINQTELNWLGYTREEVVGRLNLRDILPPESVTRFEANFPKLLEQGWLNDQELEFVRKNGSRIPMLLNTVAVHDAQGKHILDRVTVFDITERQEVAQTLQRQNENMVSLYNLTLSLFQQTNLEQMLQIIIDESMNLVNAPHIEISLLSDENNLVVRATTPPLKRVLGLVSERGKQSFLSWQAVDTGEPVLNDDYSQYPQRMNVYDLELGANAQIPIKLDRVIGVLSIAREHPCSSFSPEEIGVASLLAQLAAVAIQSAQLYNKVADELIKRREIEEVLRQNRDELSSANAALEKAARLKDEFLASMSHELRTPLTGILGLSEALQLRTYGDLNEKQLKALKNVENSGRHLLDLINDILDLSKIEAGKLDLRIEPCSLGEICQASLQLTKGLAHQRRQSVSFSMNIAPIIARADPRRLKQMLVNLLSNAIKFTPEGGELGLEVEANETDKVVRLRVWDRGLGIKPEDLHRLFKPFVQLDSSLTRQHSGSGLGLSLVQRMAELHGGSIQVESEPGAGSRFTIFLPWEPELPLSPQPSSQEIPALASALIIEDSPIDAELVARNLQSLGLSSSAHPTAAGAVEKARESKPGVILLDLKLFQDSGLEVLAALKATPGTRSIPVIIMSVEEQRAEATRLGAIGYLVKPFSQEELRTELEKARLAAAQATPPSAASQLAMPKALLLLADDNEVVLETLSDYLTAQNYRVIAARNGRELLQLAAEDLPELVLTDIQMPFMDGLDGIRKLRSHPNQQLARIPIVAVTALAMPGDRERCLAAGANEYLSKPLQLESLARLIQKLLKK